MLHIVNETNRLLNSSSSEQGGASQASSRQMTRLQRTVARRMATAKSEVPEFTTEVEVDMAEVQKIRSAMDSPPSYNDFVVSACSRALREVPKLNASYASDSIIFHERVNVGIAVAFEESLVVPTLFDADRKTVDQISSEVRDLAEKARTGSLRLSEMSEQTFTVSNLGMHGVNRFTAIISPPQVGILAVGSVRDVCVPRDGGAIVHPHMSMVLSADHRVIYGVDAARFLGSVRNALEQPDQLVGTNDSLGSD